MKQAIYGLRSLETAWGFTAEDWGSCYLQLLATVIFRRQRSLTSVSVVLLWLFENFFDIAQYIASSRRKGLKIYGVLG